MMRSRSPSLYEDESSIKRVKSFSLIKNLANTCSCLLPAIAAYITDQEMCWAIRLTKLFERIDPTFVYHMKNSFCVQHMRCVRDDMLINNLHICPDFNTPVVFKVPLTVTKITVDNSCFLELPNGLLSLELNYPSNIPILPKTLETFLGENAPTCQLPNLKSATVNCFKCTPTKVVVLDNGNMKEHGTWGTADDLFPRLEYLHCKSIQSKLPSSIRYLHTTKATFLPQFFPADAKLDTLECYTGKSLDDYPIGVKTLKLEYSRTRASGLTYKPDFFLECVDLTLNGYELELPIIAPLLKKLTLIGCTFVQSFQIPPTVTYLHMDNNNRHIFEIPTSVEHIKIEGRCSLQVRHVVNVPVVECDDIKFLFDFDDTKSTTRKIIVDDEAYERDENGVFAILNEQIRIANHLRDIERANELVLAFSKLLESHGLSPASRLSIVCDIEANLTELRKLLEKHDDDD